MTSLKKILLAGIAGPFVLAAYAPASANPPGAVPQASGGIVIAQAGEDERERRERRRGERGERGERNGDAEEATEAQDEAEAEDEEVSETEGEPQAEQAAEERNLRERVRERRQEERAEEEPAAEPEHQVEERQPEPPQEREEAVEERQPEPRQEREEAVEQLQQPPSPEPEQRAAEPRREPPAAEAPAEVEAETAEPRDRGGLRERLREGGRQGEGRPERAREETGPEPRQQAEEPAPEVERQAEEPSVDEDLPEQAEETPPAEQPGIADRLRRMLTGEDDEAEEPVAETPAEPEAESERRVEEGGNVRDRLRERRQRERDDTATQPDAQPEAERQVGEERERGERERGERERGERGERERGERERQERAEDAREPGADAVLEAGTAEERVRVLEQERRERGNLGERVRERRDRRDRAERPGERRESRDRIDEVELDREELREDVRGLRRQREAELEALERESGRDGRGRAQRSGDRVIIRSDNHIFIQNNDMRRFVRHADEVETRQLRGGFTETIVRRPGGIMIVTVRDRYGDIVTRTRVLPGGQEIVLIDNRNWYQEDRRPEFRIDYYSQVLPPLQVQIPREQYIVETRVASPVQIRQALVAPPVETVEEAYSLNEVLYNERIRDMVPRIDLDTITFEFDSAEVPDDQIDTLEDIGYALEEIIAENPEEIYLIEGHTDAPGSNEYNLALSDRRAENVAVILTEFFEIPPENLVTQGYGEEYLKIDTQAEERRNRRVTIRRITPLMAQAQ